MLDRFLDGFLVGVIVVFCFLIFSFLVIITFSPIVLAFSTNSVWWLLSYFLIVPIDFGIWNMFF